MGGLGLAVDRITADDGDIQLWGVAADLSFVSIGALAGTIPVTVVDNELTKAYDIRKPSQKPKCDLVQTVSGFFGKNPPDNARYDVIITSAAETRSARRGEPNRPDCSGGSEISARPR